MVEAITPISATAASEPTKVGTSTSIGSEPDNAWVAARQSQITADRRASREMAQKQSANELIPHADLAGEDEKHQRNRSAGSQEEEEASETVEQPTLSGESERIGTRNFDDDTPFGEREAIV
ncbi:hypothetical protein [Rhizobium binae]|uniref:Uncharacterized protein n=1 Tax=Rhizobium binae TaxID=1138190 RepID=A0ABV2M9Z8_9HYPH|nr:hypothetical protein [Rhizobium binae]NKL50864.1 hypothetical protein [Rhizobium leguminosarum bv. viciae]MBX4928923.1 hypothetical protein [Rhizobium binae]MBX4941770.1 hypothetical protein [Rhizobium binae]MBX4947785.1 hypothetical protein [Rhizobium binae]MBX4965677.1 hypothetical protein [Rhizobium binae]